MDIKKEYLSHSLSFTDRQGNANGIFYNTVRQFGFTNFTTDLELHRWVHYCHIFSSGHYRAFVDGQQLVSGPLETEEVTLPLNSTLVIGQEQDVVGGGFDRTQIFRGYITQVSIWNRSLSEREVEEMASCKTSATGNVFSSDADDLEVIGASLKETVIGSLCDRTLSFVIFPERRDLRASKLQCKRAGHYIYSPDTEAENSKLLQESLQFSDSCFNSNHLWLGITDEEEEGVWRKNHDGEVPKDLLFEGGQPNGKTNENCAFMSRQNGLWHDVVCGQDWSSCVPCTRNLRRPLLLRGLCFKRKYELLHEVLGYKNGKPYFHGYYGYMIYRLEKEKWNLVDINANKTLASLTLDTEDGYPIGRQVWVIQHSVCDHPTKTQVKLSLSVCNDTEFTCSDGDCIPRGKRCDAEDDCSDLSDEEDCIIIKLPRGYRAQRPPENKKRGKTFLIGSSVQILRFVKISDVNRVISMEMNVEVRWKDPRVEYLNLKDTPEWNRLSQREVDNVWRPKLEFPNVYDGNIRLLKEVLFLKKTDQPLDLDFNDADMGKGLRHDITSYTLCTREPRPPCCSSNTTDSGQQTHEELSLISSFSILSRFPFLCDGHDWDLFAINKRSLRQELIFIVAYSGSFACSFNVFYYPFDTQRCFVLLQLSSLRMEVASFSDEDVGVVYLEDHELPEHTVSRYQVLVTHRGTNRTRYSMLRVEFELRRRWTVIVLSLYFPSSLLLTIGYATLFVKVTLLQVRLIVSLTTLLVLYTLFNNTSDALPVTAYIKMIDVWFFSCILLLFFVIICHFVVEHLENSMVRTVQPAMFANKSTGVGRPDALLRVVRTFVVPALVVVFSIAYWSVMLGSQ
ncbi:uncharacterized protein [Panulirus ornatus]|uniref:uncharacterized protein n=1 Tax=Panulirus ornatus TaxID=150431 RepID=UPI003A8A3398